METTDTPGKSAAYSTALKSPEAKILLLASTSTILAIGAMTCADSTSSASSTSQLLPPGSLREDSSFHRFGPA